MTAQKQTYIHTDTHAPLHMMTVSIPAGVLYYLSYPMLLGLTLLLAANNGTAGTPVHSSSFF